MNILVRKGMGHTAVFNKVLVNKGALETTPYDVTTGVFTCPVAGFHLISVNIGKNTWKDCYDFEKKKNRNDFYINL